MKKVYGQSKSEGCPFCGKQATQMNAQGVSVCREHKSNNLDLKCFCGSWLDIMKGKYGAYCKCIKCGNVNLRKVLEINDVKQATKQYKEENKKEITVTSDELDFL